MRKLSFLCLFLLFIITFSFSQQDNIWYFGGQAGLDFKLGGPPGPVSTNTSAMFTREGCATYCNTDGEILLYTNGQQVYNRFHQLMQNGDGLNGHMSAFQSAIIVPLPNSETIFYIFTTDASENNFAAGYKYSIADISANGGNGSITSKNIPLLSPGSERLTAIRHANGVDAWILINPANTNRFEAWLLTCNGLQPGMVVSLVGEVMNQHAFMGVGALKASPDGKFLCQTHFGDMDGSLEGNFFQLFDFNNATGQVTNARKISQPNVYYYSCEFSPDSKLLYLTCANDFRLDQYEVTPGSAAGIAASVVPIPSAGGYFGIQLALNGKIYLTRNSNLLAVVHSPNTKGIACNLDLDALHVASLGSGLNLPQSINDIPFNPYTFIGVEVIDSCRGIIQFSGNTNLPANTQWSWDLGDGTFSNEQNPLHTYSEPGQLYKVKLRVYSSSVCGFVDRTIVISPGGSISTADFDFVPVCDSGYVRFINKSVYTDSNSVFTWDFGDQSFSSELNPVHIYATTGIYDVKLKITTTPACLNDSLIKTIELEQLDIQASADVTINAGETVQLDVIGNATSFSWSPTTWLSDPLIANPIASPQDDITYIVTARNNSGCKDIDSVIIKVNYPEGIFVPGAFTPNNDGLNDSFRPIFGQLYTLARFQVFNRWGQLIYVTTERAQGWNGTWKGKNQENGVYVWILELKNIQGEAVMRKGTVVLVR